MRLHLALATLSFAAVCPAQSLLRSVNGPAANAQYGKACIVVADQNGDGFKDVVVGAPGFNQERGAIYCLSGAYLATGTGTQTLWTCAPTANQGDLFGTAIADVGDVTGDGFGDFLVGQPGYDLASSNDSGAVRLVSGSSHQVVSLITGGGVGMVCGTAIAATGDLNYDGKSEVLIGSPGSINSTSFLHLVAGATLSMSGSIFSLNSAERTYSAGERVGTSLAGGFARQDFGNFVVSSFVVGAPGFDAPAGADAGKVMCGFVTLGGNPLNFNDEYISTTAGERLGSSVDAFSDYDGDGWIDVVAGAPNSRNGTNFDVGAAVVLSGRRLFTGNPSYTPLLYALPFGSVTPPVNHSDPEPDFHFGAAVRACADLNNDGIGEIIVGAPDYFTPGALGGWSFRGLVRVFSGATGVQLSSFTGASTDRLGDAFAGAVDDFNGDGFKEFVVAGSRSDAGGTDSGVVKCYRLFPIAPSTYCAGKLNSLGCTPSISFSGTASESSGQPFLITGSNFLNQKNGLLFYSHGPTAAVFQGGTKCVANPTVRTPNVNSGGAASGSSCTGAYSFDFNNWIVNGWDGSLGAGSEIYAQYWSRDPQSASHTSLSNAIGFVIHP